MDVSDDAFLGGALNILQPRSGYRAGLDAVLLAAAAHQPAGATCRVLDAGAGVGVVGLCVAARIAGAHVTLVEIEPELAVLAERNIARNGLGQRVSIVAADVSRGGAAFNAIGAPADALALGTFSHALANPPYHESGRGTSPADPLKAAAHQMPASQIGAWLRFMATAVMAGGTATVIYPAERLTNLLAEINGRFGALRLFPIFPRHGAAASRVIVQGTKGSKAPLEVLPGLVLHGDDGRFLPGTDAILRHGAELRIDA